MDGDAHVIMATVRFGAACDCVPVIVPRESDESVLGAVRSAVAEWFGVSHDDAPRMWLVCRGRRLSDNDNILEMLDSEGGIALFAGLSRPVEAAPRPEAVAAPETEGDALMGGMAEMLGNNPEVFAQILQMDPRVRALMDKEPMVREALSDPETLRTMIRAQSKPSAMEELQRSQERMIAQAANMPGGMALLERMHNSMARSEDALRPPAGRVPASADVAAKYSGTGGERDAPMPNPWKPHGGLPRRMSPYVRAHADPKGLPASPPTSPVDTAHIGNLLASLGGLGGPNVPGTIDNGAHRLHAPREMQLAMLMSMGLGDEAAAGAALDASDNDLDRAVHALLVARDGDAAMSDSESEEQSDGVPDHRVNDS